MQFTIFFIVQEGTEISRFGIKHGKSKCTAKAALLSILTWESSPLISMKPTSEYGLNCAAQSFGSFFFKHLNGPELTHQAKHAFCTAVSVSQWGLHDTLHLKKVTFTMSKIYDYLFQHVPYNVILISIKVGIQKTRNKNLKGLFY